MKVENTISIVTKELIEQINNASAEQLAPFVEKYEGHNYWLTEAIYKRILEILSSK